MRALAGNKRRDIGLRITSTTFRMKKDFGKLLGTVEATVVLPPYSVERQGLDSRFVLSSGHLNALNCTANKAFTSSLRLARPRKRHRINGWLEDERLP